MKDKIKNIKKKASEIARTAEEHGRKCRECGEDEKIHFQPNGSGFCRNCGNGGTELKQ